MKSITYNDIIVEGIYNDFVTLTKKYTGELSEDTYSFFDLYEFKLRNSKNQTIIVTFECFYYDNLSKKRWWNIALNIVSKRKSGFQCLKQTGTAGIESLINSKKIIKHFINNFYKYVIDSSVEDRLFIWWDDSRRRDVYLKYLSDIGFVETSVNAKDWKSGKCISNLIKK